MKQNSQKGLSAEASAEAGQTLIETLLATFILTTSLVAGLSVAIYALTASAVSKNQIIATNLAREGIEAIRMMRDSNWLAAEPDPASVDPDSTDDLQSCAGSPMNGAFCYPKVFIAPAYNFNNGVSGSFGLTFDSSSRSWSFVSDYFLFQQSDGSFSRNSNGPWQISRKITFTYLTSGDYSATYPALSVKSIVGWVGKNCTEMNPVNGDPETTNCKVIVEEQLTNWKNYK